MCHPFKIFFSNKDKGEHNNQNKHHKYKFANKKRYRERLGRPVAEVPDPFFSLRGYPPPTLGQHWLLKQFCLNHPVEHIQNPKLPKLYVKVETSTTYFIIHNQFVKNCSLSDQLFCSIFLQSPSRQQSYQIMDCK